MKIEGEDISYMGEWTELKENYLLEEIRHCFERGENVKLVSKEIGCS